MLLSSQFKKSLRSFLCCLFALSAVLIPNQSYAVYDGVRSMSYDTSRYMCKNDDYATKNFDPIMINQKTSDFELTNPACIGIMAGLGAAMLAAYTVAHTVACIPTPVLNAEGSAKQVEEAPASWFPPPLPFPNPFVPKEQAQTIYRCLQRSLEFGTYSGVCAGSAGTNAAACASSAAAGADTGRCCTAAAVYAATVVALEATLLVLWDKSKITYENARLCGHNWNQWTADPTTGVQTKGPGPYQICLKQLFAGNGKIGSNCMEILSKYDATANVTNFMRGAKNCVTKLVGGSSDSSCMDYVGTDNISKVDITNKFYREYMYGGIEFADSGDGACSNPWGSDKSLRKKYLGYIDDKQKYYMTGAGGSAPVFACYRFLSGGINEDTQKAYDCCKNRSQKAICIENKTGLGGLLGDYDYRFCNIGTTCTVADTTFEVYASINQPNYACAKTFSLCPYNHLLGGGTEKQDMSADVSNGAQVNNYCQFMNHCSKLPILPYVYSSDLDGAFIAAACKDLKGDSQNVYGYTSQRVSVNTRNFSAPMAQCFKETMENLFLNKAGTTKCKQAGENPDANGVCAHGSIYNKGDIIDSIYGDSFFVKIQKNLKSAIQIGLVISITAFGYSILMGVPKVDSFNKKAIIGYVVKVALVMYFAVGTGWQSGFLDGVLGFSGAMSELAFRLDESGDPATLDGCQFPRFNYADSNEDTRYDNPAYAPGNEYLRIWDTLDCKVARALGYGPEVSVPNLIFMILGGFFDYGAGIIFVVASLFMAFVMIMITVRSLHIFLLSTTAVILLMYVSPITITCAMFNRTKGIFSGWWKQILGLSLQPMVLFAYLGVFIAIFDHAIVGEVRFSGDGKTAPKKIICDNSSLTDVLIVDPLANGKINDNGNSTSIYCIFRMASINTFHGLEVLGIGLPVLASMTQAKLATITKSALLMFIFLQFLDKISEFAKELVGGAGLSSDIAGAGKMASRVMKGMQAIQKRGMGALAKHGGKALRKGGEAIKEAANRMGNKGKSVAGAGGDGSPPVDHGESSKEGVSSENSKGSSDSAAATKQADSSDKSSSSKKTPLESIAEGDENEENEEAADESRDSGAADTATSGNKGDSGLDSKGADEKPSTAAAEKKEEESDEKPKEEGQQGEKPKDDNEERPELDKGLGAEGGDEKPSTVAAANDEGGGAANEPPPPPPADEKQQEASKEGADGGKPVAPPPPPPPPSQAQAEEQPAAAAAPENKDGGEVAAGTEGNSEGVEDGNGEMEGGSEEGGDDDSSVMSDITDEDGDADSEGEGGSDDNNSDGDNSDAESTSSGGTSEGDDHSYMDSTVSSRAKETEKSDLAPAPLKKGSGSGGGANDIELFSAGSTPNLNQVNRVDSNNVGSKVAPVRSSSSSTSKSSNLPKVQMTKNMQRAQEMKQQQAKALELAGHKKDYGAKSDLNKSTIATDAGKRDKAKTSGDPGFVVRGLETKAKTKQPSSPISTPPSSPRSKK